MLDQFAIASSSKGFIQFPNAHQSAMLQTYSSFGLEQQSKGMRSRPSKLKIPSPNKSSKINSPTRYSDVTFDQNLTPKKDNFASFKMKGDLLSPSNLPTTLHKQPSQMTKHSDASPSNVVPIGFKPQRASMLQARQPVLEESHDPSLIMVKGNSGLLSFHDSFGRTKITKFENDAFSNMQRTNSSSFGLKLDPNYVEPKALQ